MEPSPIELMSVIEAKSGPTIRDDVSKEFRKNIPSGEVNGEACI